MSHIKQGADWNVLTTGRAPAMGTNGAVASPHYLASQEGLKILKEGGHAVDAAIAMNAVLCVVYNHMAGLGGDMFCQVWDEKTQELTAQNGSGRSGEKASLDFYKEREIHEEIPMRGHMAANTVPGVVKAWSDLHEKYGKLDWAKLFNQATDYAQNGFPVSKKFRDYIENYSDTLADFEDTASVYLKEGKPPETGDTLKQQDLANSLKSITDQGADSFYKGEIAEKIIETIDNLGGILTEEDLAEHSSEWVEPLKVDYKGYQVTELPPNTQGMSTLLLLNLIEPFNFNEIGDNTADYYHLMSEAVKVAFADSNKWITDPEFVDIPVIRLLSKDYAQSRRFLIDMKRSKSEEEIEPGELQRAAGGDTVYMCAADNEGNVCSLIQSVYHEFGSALMAKGTGFLLQNRGAFFSLEEDHVNTLKPRKRTFHTIIPAMALKQGKPVMALGTMGGEGQPQTQTALLNRTLEFGYDVQQAIEAPRWLYGRTWGETSKTLKLEGRIPNAVMAELKQRGHEVEPLENWSQKMGHAQAIKINREKEIFEAGADPRGDGLALAW